VLPCVFPADECSRSASSSASPFLLHESSLASAGLFLEPLCTKTHFLKARCVLVMVPFHTSLSVLVHSRAFSKVVWSVTSTAEGRLHSFTASEEERGNCCQVEGFIFWLKFGEVWKSEPQQGWCFLGCFLVFFYWRGVPTNFSEFISFFW